MSADNRPEVHRNMSADNPTGARLRTERKAQGYTVADLAERFRDVAPERVRRRLPKLVDLERTIRGHEAGTRPGPRYRLLYARALDVSEDELFAADVPPDGALDPDAVERVSLVAAHPARLDAATLDALAAVLAGQRRLEDAIGPAALLEPVTGQLDTISAVLRDASGPLRGDLGRIVAEWSVFAGWLNAALRRDREAVALFRRGEDLADEFDHGTVAALAVSFAGYVARKQGRQRAVVRASAAAMATPGAHPAQRVFDQLQSARAHAALGDRERALRILHDAADHADDVTDPPPPIYWYTPPFFRLVTGIAFSSLGEHESAAALVAEGKAGLPVEQQAAEWVREFDEILARDAAQR